MQKRKIKTLIKSFIVIAIFAISFQAFGIWAPPSFPQPSSPYSTSQNVYPPFNIDISPQEKLGILQLDGNFEVKQGAVILEDLIKINPPTDTSKTYILKSTTTDGNTAWEEVVFEDAGGEVEPSLYWDRMQVGSYYKISLKDPFETINIENSTKIYKDNSLFINQPKESSIYFGKDSGISISGVGGDYNIAIGGETLKSGGGHSNTAVGYQALSNNTTGYSNTGVGYQALRSNTTGYRNSALGSEALFNNTIGENNTAIGYRALYNNTTGNNNTAIGHSAGPTTSGLNNTTAIGYGAQVSSSNHIRFGNDAVSYIGGEVSWHSPSDVRFKKEIKDTDLGLDFVMKLKPVSYKYNNQENDKLNYGFIAQDLEEILGNNTNIISKDGSKDNYMSLRHADLLAPLARAIQEQQDKIKNYREELKVLEERLLKLKSLER